MPVKVSAPAGASAGDGANARMRPRRVRHDRVELGVVHQHEGRGRAAREMGGVHGAQVDRVVNVRVDHEKGAVVPEIAQVADGPARAEQPRFVAGVHGDPEAAGAHEGLHLRVQVVGVDHHGLAAGGLQLVDVVGQQRPARQGEEGFGGEAGVGQQARSQAGGQDQRPHGSSGLPGGDARQRRARRMTAANASIVLRSCAPRIPCARKSSRAFS